MNYATVLNGPFSSNNSNQYPRLGYPPNCYGQQAEMMGQPSPMMQPQQISSGSSQTVNVYQQFPQPPMLRDPRSNIHIGSKLFVGQVPAMTTEEQLRPVFEPYGELLEVKIMRDPSGRSKGSAWVRYETNEMAMNAINALHEKHTVPPQTNPLRVQFATPNSAKHQQQQQQQQQRYPLEMRAPINSYNFGGPMDGNAPQGGMVMLRPGVSSNIISSLSPNSGSGGRYVSPTIGAPIESASMMTGSYTSSAYRFDNTSNVGSRRDVYSTSDQLQAAAAQLCPPQRGSFTSLTTPQGIYNQQSPSQQNMARNNNSSKNGSNVNMGQLGSGHGMGNANSIGAPSMTADSSSFNSGTTIWEMRNNNNNGLQAQEQREALVRVRPGERKDD
ncbi:RNA-binding protein [Trypanosoma grayi]|uniref:RNA-binding protein n=1 Tax=Trypanosoma grayi TaxID=71804 RepID=UPI0004F45837|nr:RNA-binding protein [Trypanosoma grayi]KEG07005.1 RNA-binding protein [Trypanosoma grayi]